MNTENRKMIQRDSPLRDVWLKREQKELGNENRGSGIFIPGRNGELIQELIFAINDARDVICASSFIIQETDVTRSLLYAAERGIRVYLLTASETHLKKNYSKLSEYSRDIVDKHKELLDSFSGNILVRTADHLHAKFLLADPLGENPKGFLLTSNLTEKAMTENLEVCIELNPSQIKDLFVQFTRGFWAEAKQELIYKELRPAGKNPFDEFPQPEQVAWTIGDDLRLKSTILDLIEHAEKSLLISSWTIEGEHETRQAIEQRAKNGVNVQILTRPNSRNTKAISDIANSGATILGHEQMHAKVIIADNQKGIVMTSNFSQKGLDQGFEAGIMLNQDQVKNLETLFDSWKSHATWQYKPECDIESLENELLLLDGENLRKKKVVERTHVDLGYIKVKDEKESSKEPDRFPWPDETDELYKSVEYKWIVKTS